MFGSMVGNLASSTVNNFASYKPSSGKASFVSNLTGFVNTVGGFISPLLGREKEALNTASTVHVAALPAQKQDVLLALLPVAIGVGVLVMMLGMKR